MIGRQPRLHLRSAVVQAIGVRLVFAELKDVVRQKIERYDLGAALREGRYYPTVRTAVEAYEAQTGSTWVPGPGPYLLD